MKDNIIIERLETHINFLDSIKRSKLKTFESANKKVMVKTSDKRLIEYQQQGNLAFQFLAQAEYLDKKINMKLLMSFPITPVPLSIGTSNAMLLKTDTAKGMHYLLKNQLSPEKADKNFKLVIEDGNALLYALKDIPCDFKEICFKTTWNGLFKTCDKIFSTDMYYPDSVKSMERHRRGSGGKLIIKGANIKKPKCWEKKLSNHKNKHQLIKLMLNVQQTNLTASHLTNRSLTLICEAEAFCLHSTDGKNTNSQKVSELKSSQEETDTCVIKTKRLQNRSHKNS